MGPWEIPADPECAAWNRRALPAADVQRLVEAAKGVSRAMYMSDNTSFPNAMTELRAALAAMEARHD